MAYLVTVRDFAKSKRVKPSDQMVRVYRAKNQF